MIHTSLKSRGFSLVECCVSLGISALIAAIAVPSMDKTRLRQSLQLQAQTVMTDLQQARSDAVLHGTSVHLRFRQLPEGTCYVLHTGEAPNDCQCSASGEAVCRAGAQAVRQHWLPSSSRLTLVANVNGMSFHSRQGTVTATGRIDLRSDDGATIRHIVSIAGRVRTCSPGRAVAAFPACA